MSRNGDEIARSGISDRQSRSESIPVRDGDASRVAMPDRPMKGREGHLASSMHASTGGEEDMMHVNFRALEGEEEVVKTLPPPLMRRMQREKLWLYPDDMIPWHGDLRGIDGPSRKNIASGRHTTASVARKMCVTFRWESERYDIACSVGKFCKPEEGNPHSGCVSMNWITHSQLPGLVFTVRRGGDLPPAKVWLFVNSFAQMTDDEGNTFPKLGHSMNADVLETADPWLGLSTWKGTLWKTWFCLWSDEQVAAGASDDSPVKPARPQVTGISRTELDGILAAGNLAEKKGDLDVLSPGDWALWGFLTTVNIQVIRTWNETDAGMDIQRFFVNYMYMHMSNVLAHGDWPHYVRQAHEAGKDIYASDYDLTDVEPPRNMVTQWRVKYQDDKAVAAQAEMWAKFAPLEVYPTMKAKAFGIRLATERAHGGWRFLLNTKVNLKTGNGKPQGNVLGIHQAAQRSPAAAEPRDDLSAASASLAAPVDAPQSGVMKEKVHKRGRRGKQHRKVPDDGDGAAEQVSSTQEGLVEGERAPSASRKRRRRGKQYRKVPDGDNGVAELVPPAQEGLVDYEPAPSASHGRSIHLTSTDGDNMNSEKMPAALEEQAEGKSAPKSGRKRGRKSKRRNSAYAYYDDDPRETCLVVDS